MRALGPCSPRWRTLRSWCWSRWRTSVSRRGSMRGCARRSPMGRRTCGSSIRTARSHPECWMRCCEHRPGRTSSSGSWVLLFARPRPETSTTPIAVRGAHLSTRSSRPVRCSHGPCSKTSGCTTKRSSSITWITTSACARRPPATPTSRFSTRSWTTDSAIPCRQGSCGGRSTCRTTHRFASTTCHGTG